MHLMHVTSQRKGKGGRLLPMHICRHAAPRGHPAGAARSLQHRTSVSTTQTCSTEIGHMPAPLAPSSHIKYKQ
jgi:hypothetical protein